MASSYISKGTAMELTFTGRDPNDTLVVYGHIDGLVATNTSIPASARPLSKLMPQDYDSMGALTYVVAVIVVYSISMFLIVATYLRRKSAHKSLDGQVHSYIKGLEAARARSPNVAWIWSGRCPQDTIPRSTPWRARCSKV